MRRGLLRPGCVLGGLLLLLSSGVPSASDEPADAPPPSRPATYADHPASWWVDQLDRSPGSDVARQVLRWMGASAVPALSDAALDRRGHDRRAVWALLVELARRHADLSAAAAMLGQAIDAPDPQVRAWALQIVALSPPMRPQDTDAAIALLRAPDAQTRANTLFFLKSRTTFDDATIDAIGACLLDPSEFVVESALRTLSEAAPRNGRVADVTLRARTRVPAGQRRQLLLVLGRVRPVRADVLDALDVEIRAEGDRGPPLWALAAAAPDAREALDRLVGVVRAHPDDATRGLAAEVLASLKSVAAPVLPVIAPLLRDRSARVRHEVQHAIEACGAAAGPVVPEILKSCEPGADGSYLLYQLAPLVAAEIVAGLPDAPESGRNAAIGALLSVPDATLTPVAGPLRKVLATHLSTLTGRPTEAPPTVQLMARLALVDPSLAEGIAEDFHAYLKRVPWMSAQGQSNLGGYAISQGVRRAPRAFPIVADAFLRAANDEAFPIESRVAFYRMSVGPPDTAGQRARLVKDLEHPVPEIAEAAGSSLWGDLGAVPDVLARLAEPRVEIRLRVARVLLVFVGMLKLSPEQEQRVLPLVRDDPDPRVRAMIASLLLQQWTTAMPGEPRLPDGLDRVAFARALTDGLSTDDPEVRALSVWRIRTFAAEAADALPALRRLAEAPDAGSAQVARESIEAIEAATKAK